MNFPQYNKQGYLKSPFTISSQIILTGTTVETILYDQSPNFVGLIQENDYFEFELMVQATNNANSKRISWYISDNQNSLVNEVLIGRHTATTGWGSPAIKLQRFLKMNGALNSNTYLDNTSSSTNLNNFYTSSTSVIKTDGVIDFSSGTKYLIVTGILNNALDELKIFYGNSCLTRP